MGRFGRTRFVLPTPMLVSAFTLSGSPASATTPGWIDLTYGVSGAAIVPAPTLFATSTVVDSNGRAIVLGATSASGKGDRVTRMTTGGAIDASFGSGGAVDLPPANYYTKAVVAPSGTIFLLGGDAPPTECEHQGRCHRT